MHGTYIKKIGIANRKASSSSYSTTALLVWPWLNRKVYVPQISLDKGFDVVNKEIEIHQSLILRSGQWCCKIQAAEPSSKSRYWSNWCRLF